MRHAAEIENAPDIIITEIGGTVGDIESLPFMEAARQVRRDVGRKNVFFLHVSLVPFIGPSGELNDQADPALCGRSALYRYSARCAGAAYGSPAARGNQGQGCTHVRRRQGCCHRM